MTKPYYYFLLLEYILVERKNQQISNNILYKVGAKEKNKVSKGSGLVFAILNWLVMVRLTEQRPTGDNRVGFLVVECFRWKEQQVQRS